MVSSILVVGANSGLGLGVLIGFLERYPSAHVYGTARDISKAPILDRVTWLHVEVSDESTIKARSEFALNSSRRPPLRVSPSTFSTSSGSTPA